ncbi:type I toxin-antitoxin system ptaRNA1 family toxin [Burkholderia pseudomallei]|nr:type I toxin-antitoxin system ptaRNA1 family toxin [Burkholderia pseudomallei]
MATTHHIEAPQVIYLAAAQLTALDFIDQHTARALSQTAEAIANLFTVVFYQAETGRAAPSDFNEAVNALRTALQQR